VCGYNKNVSDAPFLFFFDITECASPMIFVHGCKTPQVCTARPAYGGVVNPTFLAGVRGQVPGRRLVREKGIGPRRPRLADNTEKPGVPDARSQQTGEFGGRVEATDRVQPMRQILH